MLPLPVPAILNGPVPVTVDYSDNLIATLTCRAFGGIGELFFMWDITSSTGPNTTSQMNFVDPVDGSTTGTINTNTLTVLDRGSIYMCRVRYENGILFEESETATLSIGEYWKVPAKSFKIIVSTLCSARNY